MAVKGKVKKVVEVHGTITMPVSIKIEVEEGDALDKAWEMFNPFNADMNELGLKTSKEIHKAKVHDIDVVWEKVFDDE